jgi:hypothetical protein
MSVIESNKVDSVINNAESEDVVLLISDHLGWEEPTEHLLKLQTKLNTYINFVDSGQLETDFQDCVGKSISIIVACQYEPSKEGLDFYHRAHDFLFENKNMSLSYSVES